VDDDKRSWIKLKATWLICFVAVIGASGCFGLNRGAPPLQHYVLEGGHSHEAGGPLRDTAGLSIGLRRLQLASYLDAPFIVVRRGPHQIGRSDFHRWGEDLGGGINRAVAGHLLERGVFRAVDVAPWAPRARQDHLIQLHVMRFEGQLPEDGAALDGDVHVVATWEIIDPDDGTVLTRGTTDYRANGWNVGDYLGLVRLLDAGLGVVADDLAAAIETLGRATPTGAGPPA
jgi:uncharacterized lipoprotein YmbA